MEENYEISFTFNLQDYIKTMHDLEVEFGIETKEIVEI